MKILQLVCRPLRMGCASVGMLAWVTFCRDLAGKLEGQRFLSTFCGDLAWKMGGGDSTRSNLRFFGNLLDELPLM